MRWSSRTTCSTWPGPSSESCSSPTWHARSARWPASPSRRVVLVVYGPPDRVEFLTVFLGALQTVLPDFQGLPSDPPPLPFQIADPEKLRGALADAVSGKITIETITESLRFRAATDMWNWVVNSNPIGAMLVADLSPEQRTEVERVLDGMLAARSVEGTAVLTNPVHIAVATV